MLKNKSYKVWFIVAILISVMVIGSLVFYNYFQKSQTAPTIHVVISPISNESDYPNGSYVVYYEDYFSPPTSYWKKDFDIAYTQFLAMHYASDKAKFVSSPVVIVAPKWFDPFPWNCTNADGKSVEYQWYGGS
jgi:hypothetical protein